MIPATPLFTRSSVLIVWARGRGTMLQHLGHDAFSKRLYLLEHALSCRGADEAIAESGF